MPIDRIANAVALPLIVLGPLLLTLGIIGLLLRYGQAAGAFGRFSLGLSALGGIVCAVGIVGSSFSENGPWWRLFVYGMLFQFLGMALFGIVNLKQRVLPRWNALPFLTGIFVPLFALVPMFGLPISTNLSEDFPGVIFTILLMVSLAGYAGIGYLLQSSAQPENLAAVAV